jgi:hypothetical protein
MSDLFDCDCGITSSLEDVDYTSYIKCMCGNIYLIYSQYME